MANPYINRVDVQRGNTVDTLINISDTTATASDVAQGKYFYLASGEKVQGTNQGGGSVTQDQDGFIVLPSTGGGGGTVTLKEGVIRPDAELVKSWSYDKWIVEDEEVTLPSYTTTTKNLKASETIESVNLDYDTYDYMLIGKGLAIPSYVNGTAHGSGYEEYHISAQMYELSYKHLYNLPTLDKSKSMSSYFVYGGYNINLYAYWSSATGFTSAASAAFGGNVSFSTPTISAASVTIKSPVLRLNGNASYFPQAFYDALEDIRYQYVIELWRAPKSNLNFDGWTSQQELMHIVSNIINDDATLD